MPVARKAKPKRAPFTTLLVFPPQWTPQNPHFGICQLAGHLRAKGHTVLLRDLNVEFYDQVLTPQYLKHAADRIRLNYQYLRTKNVLRALVDDNSFEFQVEGARCIEMERFLKEEEAALTRIPELILDAKETLRDPRRFYDPLLLVEAFRTIDKALEIISLPYHPARITFNGFDQPHCLMVTASLLQHTADRGLNLFHDFLASQVEGLLAQSPNLIGISINSSTQVLPGLTLARMLMEQAPRGCHISIGGNYLGRVKEALLRRPEFFHHFAHSLTMGEGERQLLLLIEQLSGAGNLSRVPDMLYCLPGDDRVVQTREAKAERLDRIGFQSLDGLPLDKYLTPQLVLCIQSSKGCYWGKCTFCDSDFGVDRDIKGLDRLVDEIRHLRDHYGVKHFEFIDESIQPAYMAAMARRFIDDDLGINWFCNGRLEDAFTPELLELLHRSGLTMVLWGFESGNRRIMELINKGVAFDTRYQILENASAAGIWNFAYIFFGFPTETREEAMETIQAICRHRDAIHSYGRSVFTLGKHSLLSIEPERYGIFEVVADEEELSSALHYRSRTGMDDQTVDQVMKDCTRICADAYGRTLWYALRYRENIHLYLARHGKDYVRQLKIADVIPAGLEVW